MSASTWVAAALQNTVSRGFSTAAEQHNIIILGGGIAGLSTARYLLRHTESHSNVKITLIDRNDIVDGINIQPSLSYAEQQSEYPHFCTPSRRNGNVLCPSLTIPWTTRSLFSEAIMPALKSFLFSPGGTANSVNRPAITFDWANIIFDRNIHSFAMHYFIQKWIRTAPKRYQCNKSILQYNMRCLDDPSDTLVQSINYGRFAKGTKLVDDTIVEGDSSGDVGLFCRGLLSKLNCEYSDRFAIRSGESIERLLLAKDRNDRRNDARGIDAVVTIDKNGIKTKIKGDQFVVAMGNESRPLCDKIKVPCPIYPVKGHLVTISSSVDYVHNITLPGGIGYAAPMDHKVRGRRLYRLSGFVDFTSDREPDQDRIDALIDLAKVYLDDVELIDASACHRPLSADDRPIIGPSPSFSNLHLVTGFGSRGWSVGLGSGSLLASLMLGLPCDIDPAPYLPSRFGTGIF